MDVRRLGLNGGDLALSFSTFLQLCHLLSLDRGCSNLLAKYDIPYLTNG